MSAPLAVNTADGVCWTRRATTRGGLALYAPEGVCSCPEFVMATLEELAEHGITGSADVLPMPVGTEARSLSVLDRARDALGARMAKDDLRHVLGNVVAYAAELERQLSVKAEAARSVHVKYPDSEHCQHDGEPWPCPTLTALAVGGDAR
jgi:hypothetical protein